MANVSKLELIASIARETQITSTRVRETVETLFAVIESYLAQGKRIEIRGFGSIEAKKRKPKLVRNPKRPGEEKILPERYAPCLRFSRDFKEVINQTGTPNVEQRGDFHFITIRTDFAGAEVDRVSETVSRLFDEGARQIVVDFDKVKYIYSPGLAGLVRFHRKLTDNDGQFYVVNIRPNVLSKMESVNLNRALPLFRTKQDLVTAKNLP